MTASERLAGLDAMVWSSSPAQRDVAKATLWTALPEIVAVVKAAKRAETYLQKSAYLVGAEGVLEELAPAIAALEEKLGT